MYITKSDLNKMLSQLYEENNDYPKPLLYIVTLLLTIVVALMCFIIIGIISIGFIVYIPLYLVDVIVGKYIIKRILK